MVIRTANKSSIFSGISSCFRFTYRLPRSSANRLSAYQQPYYGLLDRYVLSTDPPLPQILLGTSSLINYIGPLAAPRLQPRIHGPVILCTWTVPRRALLLRCERLDTRHHCSGWRGRWRDHGCRKMIGEYLYLIEMCTELRVLDKSNDDWSG
jgi:hypothetical protein